MFNMSQEQCMEALSKHANIMPVITATVWKELEKENKEFFEAYTKKREERSATTNVDTWKMLPEYSSKSNSVDGDDDDDGNVA